MECPPGPAHGMCLQNTPNSMPGWPEMAKERENNTEFLTPHHTSTSLTIPLPPSHPPPPRQPPPLLPSSPQWPPGALDPCAASARASHLQPPQQPQQPPRPGFWRPFGRPSQLAGWQLGQLGRSPAAHSCNRAAPRRSGFFVASSPAAAPRREPPPPAAGGRSCSRRRPCAGSCAPPPTR